MPRGLAIMVLLLALVVGGLIFLSSGVKEQPLQTIETDVTANAG